MEYFIIIFIHWVADFVLQSHTMSMNKSKSNLWLIAHTISYSGTFLLVGTGLLMAGIVDAEPMLWFFLITLACHTIQDYITSRITSRLWKAQKVHNFFVVIGFDQVLHYGQLFLTYHILFK